MQAFEKFSRALARYFEWVGAAGMLIMFVVNLVDVFGAKVFRQPLPGALEVLGFALLVTIAPAIAHGLFLGTHLSIDFILDKFPRWLRAVINPLIFLACLILFVLICWQSYVYGGSLYRAGEMGSSSKIPFFPFAYLLSISCVPAILYFAVQISKCFKAEK
jgi:TRAP-type C4-dicarboxylate transport system permease small subunit